MSLARTPALIGVAGGSGSGKTTPVNKLIERLAPAPVSLVRHDWYYRDLSHLTEEQRSGANFDHPEALETTLLLKHLDTLLKGGSVKVPCYDFETHTRLQQTREISPAHLILVEGILLFTDERLRRRCDLRIFVQAGEEMRFQRRAQRDVRERGRPLNSVRSQFQSTVKPMHDRYVEPSARHAHLIFPAEQENEAGVDILAAGIRNHFLSL